MTWSIWVVQERDDSVCSPTVWIKLLFQWFCDERLSNGGLVTANWRSIISLVWEIFSSMPLWAAQVSKPDWHSSQCVTLNLVTTGYWYQNCQITVDLSVSFTEHNTETSYTNQKTFRSLQVTLDYWHALVTKFTSAIRHNTSARYWRIMQYQRKHIFSNSCKTHSKAVSLKYMIEHTNIDTRKITHCKHRT